MKSRVKLLAICSLAILLISSGAFGAHRLQAGRLYRIDIKSEHPKAYHPSIGDLVQCYLDFPIVPEQIVADLEVSIAGRPVSLVAVVSTSSPKIVGSGQISVYLSPRQTGMSKVTIQPVIPGQNPKPIKIVFLVEAERDR